MESIDIFAILTFPSMDMVCLFICFLKNAMFLNNVYRFFFFFFYIDLTYCVVHVKKERNGWIGGIGKIYNSQALLGDQSWGVREEQLLDSGLG